MSDISEGRTLNGLLDLSKLNLACGDVLNAFES